MRPEDVVSPKGRLRNLRVIYQNPDWALAQFEWCDIETIAWIEVVGIRWNGDIDDADDKGNPRSHDNAIWFILPEPIGNVVVSILTEARRLNG
jgi:hypothetical protein